MATERDVYAAEEDAAMQALTPLNVLTVQLPGAETLSDNVRKALRLAVTHQCFALTALVLDTPAAHVSEWQDATVDEQVLVT